MLLALLVLLMLPRYLSNVLCPCQTRFLILLFSASWASPIFNIFLCRYYYSMLNFLKPQSHNSSFFNLLFIGIFQDFFLIVFILLNVFLNPNWLNDPYLYHLWFYIIPSSWLRLNNDLSLLHYPLTFGHTMLTFRIYHHMLPWFSS